MVGGGASPPSPELTSLLLSIKVFSSSEWPSFLGLLPDLEYLPCFGCTGLGEANSEEVKDDVIGIEPNKCLFYLPEEGTILHKALWLGAPVDVLEAIISKNSEDPLKRNLCSTIDSEGNLPLHVAAAALDSAPLLLSLISLHPASVNALNSDGMTPLQIHEAGATVEGLPPRLNSSEIGFILSERHASYTRLNCCAGCGKGEELKRCTRCMEIVYCGKECQRKHWKEHKKACKPVTGK